MINIKVNTYFSYMLVISISVYKGRGYGDLAANIGPTNEKPFTNITPNQPTILTISDLLKESAFSKSKTSHASHEWAAVNNHMWPDEPLEAG